MQPPNANISHSPRSVRAWPPQALGASARLSPHPRAAIATASEGGAHGPRGPGCRPRGLASGLLRQRVDWTYPRAWEAPSRSSLHRPPSRAHGQGHQKGRPCVVGACRAHPREHSHSRGSGREAGVGAGAWGSTPRGQPGPQVLPRTDARVAESAVHRSPSAPLPFLVHLCLSSRSLLGPLLGKALLLRTAGACSLLQEGRESDRLRGTRSDPRPSHTPVAQALRRP